MNIAAGFVLFNPNKDRFHNSLNNVLCQFDKLIIYDNVGGNDDLFEGMEKVVYITENENRGIAYGLNQIMKRAKEIGYNWVVTLDQDTVVPMELANRFAAFSHLDNVAIVSPQVIDRRRKYLELTESNEEVIDIDFCITSASCTNINIWEKLGGFDEKLFIDFVDNDYCKRAKTAGYRILQIPSLVIDQQFGNITLKSPAKVRFYLWLSKVTHNKNIAKLTYHKEVSPFRVYYVHRNLIYLNKKFKEFGGIGYDNFYCKSFAGFLLYFTLPSLIRGHQKLNILRAIVKGLIDGHKIL